MAKKTYHAPYSPCPHCGNPLKTRLSRQLSELSREITMQCENPECLYCAVVIQSHLRVLQSSMNPNPRVFVPLSPRKYPLNHDGQLDLLNNG
ncbi:transcriptional activator Ogr Delta [Ferriphaselus amnicola]|uniref:Transcriptional activator Ogr Delta n=1 Tax=Ferriphaselus amnicola TaxID=1188319 RepID=A0A2Z6GC58_9PROT|nr:ogr/Delta-like zinc finger family protein [Ferriphaselus amnicola]BBE51163.1 transcriptional activator Ogr Delta [Ferriphaselus amnicola]